MTIVYDRNSFSYTENGSILQDRGDDSMKQNAKNKLISELAPARILLSPFFPFGSN